MNQRARTLIRESLALAKVAPTDKKIKLLQMVKEIYRKSLLPQHNTVSESVPSRAPVLPESTSNPDYVEEK